MNDKPVPARPIIDLRSFTPARVALGRSGASLPTRPLLDFTLDHARARDAVHAAFDAPQLAAGLDRLGVAVSQVKSRAADRSEYLRRPDLGRQLDAGSAEALARAARADASALSDWAREVSTSCRATTPWSARLRSR